MVGEEDMIRYMSENPRFGNLQSEEKEYFSGSIVESMSEDRVVSQPVLKRSNSFNEERLVTHQFFWISYSKCEMLFAILLCNFDQSILKIWHQFFFL